MSSTALMAKAGMVVLLGAAVPIGVATPEVWLQWGLAGVVVAFTLWRDHHRERRMTATLERLDAWIRDTLLDAMQQNTTAMHEFTRTVRTTAETRRMNEVRS